MFDWVRFLDAQSIDYATRGPNIARGNIGIACPFCGNDPSHHMGISLNGEGWGCWRNKKHRGRHPARLVSALLGCSMDRAYEIVGGGRSLPADFMSYVQSKMAGPVKAAKRDPLSVPPEFKIISDLPSARPYRQYLRDRGFTDGQIDRMSKRYDMRYCTSGMFKGRIIFLVYYNDQLVSWTGRTIFRGQMLRYKALTSDPEVAERDGCPLAVGPISHYLLWFDDLMSTDADTIYLVEGPFDALKINVLGRAHGICATCFFTITPTAQQEPLLHELLPRFKNRYLMLDHDAIPRAIEVQSSISSLGIHLRQVPEGLKDPGELSSVKQLLRNFD